MDIYEQLRRDEGLQLSPYLDTVGKTTLASSADLACAFLTRL
jgi:hypothetical protein